MPKLWPAGHAVAVNAVVVIAAVVRGRKACRPTNNCHRSGAGCRELRRVMAPDFGKHVTSKGSKHLEVRPPLDGAHQRRCYGETMSRARRKLQENVREPAGVLDGQVVENDASRRLWPLTVMTRLRPSLSGSTVVPPTFFQRNRRFFKPARGRICWNRVPLATPTSSFDSPLHTRKHFQIIVS